jgi:hypothetical protein
LKRCILRSRRRVGWCGFPPDCSYASRARGAPIIRFRTLPRRKSADCRSQEHRFLEQFAHEFHGGSLVAPSLHQQVEDLAFVVDCAPQPELPARNPHGHLVEMPARRWLRASTAKFSGEQRPELQNPSPHRFIGDIQTALGQQIFDVAIAEREAYIEPDGAPADRRRELVAGK